VALRTQHIIAHESGVTETVDPVAGGYYVESLTNQMEEKATEYFEKIDNMGGVYPAIEKGFFQKEIANSAFKYQREIETCERKIVGINDYTIANEYVTIPLLRIDPKVEHEQLTGLRKLRRERDNAKVKKSLEKLHDDAVKDKNLMPTIIEAVKAYVTLGEICEVLRNVYGEYKELIVI
jgi:methylmalonyl-CoA mutase N-terminal domain/subunit